MSGGIKLAESELVVVFVVEHVKERREEWVEVLLHQASSRRAEWKDSRLVLGIPR